MIMNIGIPTWLALGLSGDGSLQDNRTSWRRNGCAGFELIVLDLLFT